jgi:hypothetical protein
MDEDQTPLLPTKPWVTRSAWSFAPALFFYELFLCVIWIVLLGTLVDPSLALGSLLPMLGYSIYKMGAKCAIEETEARVPRRRLWGTSLMVSLVFGVFTAVLVFDQLADLRVNSPSEFEEQMAVLFAGPGISAEVLAMSVEEKLTAIAIAFALLVFGVFFVIHLLSLWVGVRSIEKTSVRK